MSKRYEHLLSPFKTGNVVFRNRMTASASNPSFVQGPEPYPAEGFITHYANKAKNGAAFVTVSNIRWSAGYSPDNLKTMYEGEDILKNVPRWVDFKPTVSNLPGHYASFDGADPKVQHYIAQLTEAIHFYGAKASALIMGTVPPGYDVSTGIPSLSFYGMGGTSTVGKEIPAELLEEVADDYACQAAAAKENGFDMCYIHMAYRITIMGRMLSPLTNKRTDQYGGSLGNRARFPLMVADRIHQRCGKDFIIEASMSGFEPEGGITLEDAIKYAEMFTGHFDLLQIRTYSIDAEQPTGFNLERTPLLNMAEAIKKSNPEIGIVAIGGFSDLQDCEDAIASGKADFIGMARSWISNPDFGRLAYEGRGEDVVPCIRCNKCLKNSYAYSWASVCSVNPTWGLEHRIERMIVPPHEKKRVAVIGGGPAGMEAALIAAGRGHQVTLYEKSDALGGLLKTADTVSFKWPLKDFKNYLIRQIEKSNVKLRLNTEATPEMLKEEGYDAVLAAVGSEPIIPPIPGVEGKNVVFAKDVYGNEDTLAEEVVIIGGGEIGVETGMHLAEKGHKVTLLEMLEMLAPDAAPLHYYCLLKEAWEKLANFKYILKARCNGIGVDKVTYIDNNGIEHALKAGSVVIAIGMKPNSDLALKFFGTGDRFYMIGDCDDVGNVQKVMRSAFGIASTL